MEEAYMKETILGLIHASMKEYLRYSNSIEHPSLRRFMRTIIDQEREHLEEIKGRDESLFNGLSEAALHKEIQACSQTLELESDQGGLQEVMLREEAMADLFEGLAESVSEEEGRILFKQYSLDERKHAGLVRARLELESLI